MSVLLPTLFLWSFVFQAVAGLYSLRPQDPIPSVRTLVIATCLAMILVCCWNLGSPVGQTSVGISFSVMAIMAEWPAKSLGLVPARLQILAIGLCLIAYGVLQ